MKLIKIRFTRFRDAALGRSAATQKQLDDLNAAEGSIRGEIVELKELQEVSPSDDGAARLATLAKELAGVFASRKVILGGEELAAADAADKARNHKRAGTFGYQVISDDGRVEKVVDDKGQDLPAGCHYGSEVVEVDPSLPAWAKTKAKIAH